jgi:hypothetical protein
VNGRVPLDKHLVERRLKRLRPQLAEALAEQAVEAQIGALLAAALDNHVGDLELEAVDAHLEQLVRALFES